MLLTQHSSFLLFTTVPCAPENVKYTGDSQSAVLSWDASVFATSYIVYNVSGAGRVKLCSTTGLSCQLVDFNPGTTEVTASNAEGESFPTRDITGQIQVETDMPTLCPALLLWVGLSAFNVGVMKKWIKFDLWAKGRMLWGPYRLSILLLVSRSFYNLAAVSVLSLPPVSPHCHFNSFSHSISDFPQVQQALVEKGNYGPLKSFPT